MRIRWRWTAIGVVVVVAVAISVLLVVDRGGGGAAKNAGGASGKLPDESYAILWAGTRVGQREAAVLARWPKHPYQHYSDNLREDCYEWEDQAVGPDKILPAHLYNLCFKGGVLRLKTVF